MINKFQPSFVQISFFQIHISILRWFERFHYELKLEEILRLYWGFSPCFFIIAQVLERMALNLIHCSHRQSSDADELHFYRLASLLKPGDWALTRAYAQLCDFLGLELEQAVAKLEVPTRLFSYRFFSAGFSFSGRVNRVRWIRKNWAVSQSLELVEQLVTK